MTRGLSESTRPSATPPPRPATASTRSDTARGTPPMAEPATAKASLAASTPAAACVLTAVSTQGASPKASGSARDSRICATVTGPPLEDQARRCRYLVLAAMNRSPIRSVTIPARDIRRATRRPKATTSRRGSERRSGLTLLPGPDDRGSCKAPPDCHGHHCAQPILRRFVTVRAVLAMYNTHAEVDLLAAALPRLALRRT